MLEALTDRARQILQLASDEARHAHARKVDTEHILLGLLRVQKGLAFEVLVSLGLQVECVREEILNVLSREADAADAHDPAGAVRPRFGFPSGR